MDLRGIANGVAGTVNPNETVTVLRSNGYGIDNGRVQYPIYFPPVTGPAQVQALDGKDLQQLDGMNIQGDIKTIFLRGALAGVIRPNESGGDIIKRKNGSEVWLVVKVLESWPTWTKAAIVKQGGA